MYFVIRPQNIKKKTVNMLMRSIYVVCHKVCTNILKFIFCLNVDKVLLPRPTTCLCGGLLGLGLLQDCYSLQSAVIK